jgi:hypothetical protein
MSNAAHLHTRLALAALEAEGQPHSANYEVLPTGRDMIDPAALGASNSDFLSTLDSEADFNSRMASANQVAGYFADNIIGRMNSVNASNQMFSATLAPELFDVVFGNTGTSLGQSRPSNGLMGEWRAARSVAEANNISQRSAFAETLAFSHSLSELESLSTQLVQIVNARASFLSETTSNVAGTATETGSTVVGQASLLNTRSFAPGNSLLPPAPRLGQLTEGSVQNAPTQEANWKSVFDAAPIVVIPSTRDVLNDPQQFLKRGQQFYGSSGKVQAITGTDPISTLNTLAKSIGLPEVPSELYRKPENKVVKLTGTASKQEGSESFDFEYSPQSVTDKDGRFSVALDYGLAREIANQMGITYSDAKKQGGENQLTGTITFGDSGKEYPIAVDRVVSQFDMRNWEHIVTKSLHGDDVVDISNSAKSRIVEVPGAMLEQMTDFGGQRAVKATISLSSTKETDTLTPQKALKNIGNFYQEIA